MSILITGYTSQIGKSTLRLYKEMGKSLILVGRSKHEGEEILGPNNSTDNKHFFLDFLSKSFKNDLDKLIHDTTSFSQLETVIHLAAYPGRRSQLRNLSYEELTELININFINSAWFLNQMCKCMSENGCTNNSFVFISSQLAKYKGPNLSIYSACKAAMNNLCMTMANEYGKDGVRVNIISPGIVAKDTLEANNYKASLDIPLARLATPIDVAQAIVYIASNKASYVNGANLDVNGGR